METLLENTDLYLEGFFLTIELTIISVLCGFILSIILVWMYYQNFIFSYIAKIFIYVFRGSPLLVQIYLIYYGVGQLEFIKESFLWDFFKEPYLCALLALAFNNASYTTEIFRNAIINTSTLEKEAAISYGMNTLQMYKYIIIPSAIRSALPAYSNEVIFMLHATSLCSTITLVELTGAARIVNSTHYIPFEAFSAAAVFYMIITFTLVGMFKLIERKIYRQKITNILH